MCVVSRSPYEEFPHIITSEVTLRKIVETDLDRLFEIYSNENLFQYSPVMLKKNKETVKNMISHFDRDFNKRKGIFLGICQSNSPDSIVGIAEMFDYNSDVKMITIGYRLHEQFWGKGIATMAVNAMTAYLFNRVGVNRIQAFVLPENTKSKNVLQRNKFTQEGIVRQGYIWRGRGVVDLVMYSLLQSDNIK